MSDPASDPTSDGVWQRGEVLWRSALGGLTAVSPTGGEPLVVSAPAGHVWAQLAEPKTIDEIARSLAELFIADIGVIEDDLAQLLARLEAVGVVRRR